MSENRLNLEKSPYLLQHQKNPVHWYAWGEEAFRAANDQNKPIFLSIGYSTCHWCHVMAHESFEDKEVADLLNREFISIKLDREERPDIDEIYMAAVQAMRQRGGWPLSVFLTPDLRPFFGGTYFPKQNFLAILDHLARMWKEDPGKIRESGDSLFQFLKEEKNGPSEPSAVSQDVFGRFYRSSLLSFDSKWGGFGNAPKFPHPMQMMMLLRIHRRTGEARALYMVEHSLERMARGGIYDHLGFGFARYSTDERWLVPHFEKMLYDNALLVTSYLEAYQITKKEMFKRVAQECLDYTLSVMTHPEGGFYSAEDADSEGEEGKFYVWEFEELRSLLSPEEFDLFSQVYQLSPEGNFEGKNILWLSDRYGWEIKDDLILRGASQKLFDLREKRIHPHKDDKILTAWNGLMIRAMALGYQVLGDDKYLRAAQRAAAFLKTRLWPSGQLLARYREGDARFVARLEDYAFLIQALVDLYQCDFNTDMLRWALELQQAQDKKFWDEKNGGYFHTDGTDHHLLVRTKEGMDGALPNANGVSALNLLRLSDLNFDAGLRQRAERTFQAFSKLLMEYSHAFSQMMIALDYYTDSAKEVAVVQGADSVAEGFLKKARLEFLPNQVLAVGPENSDFPELLKGKTLLQGKSAFYICQERSCEAPTPDSEIALQALAPFKQYTID